MLYISNNHCETSNGLITNVEDVVSNVNRLCESDCASIDVMTLIDEAHDIIYLDDDGEISNESQGSYKLIGINMYEADAESAKQIYVSLHRSNEGFMGFFVGSYMSLASSIKRRREARDESADSFDSEMTRLYDMLMDKEYWKRGDDVVSSLRQYLNATLCRCLEVCGVQHVITKNENQSRLCFNSRLVDKYGNFIYIAMNNVEIFNRYCDVEIIISKSDYAKAGFLGQRPGVVSYFNDLHDVVFQGSLSEFDLEDTTKLDHMREASRTQRLPEAYQSISAVDMADCIKTSVEAAMRQRLTDYTYFVPMYSIALKQIQFLIPLKLQRQYSELAEVALIIGKDRRTGFYTINTLIDVELAYTNARTISSSVASWLERAMANRRQSEE